MGRRLGIVGMGMDDVRELGFLLLRRLMVWKVDLVRLVELLELPNDSPLHFESQTIISALRR